MKVEVEKKIIIEFTNTYEITTLRNILIFTVKNCRDKLSQEALEFLNKINDHL